jgi:hypothetical protein
MNSRPVAMIDVDSSDSCVGSRCQIPRFCSLRARRVGWGGKQPAWIALLYPLPASPGTGDEHSPTQEPEEL